MGNEPLIKATQLCAEATNHLRNELLPFWISRLWDQKYGGYITHFDKNGNFTGEQEKSLIAQSRSLYSMSAASRAGYHEGECRELAELGFNHLIDKFWDNKYHAFYWMTDRQGKVINDQKILYGQSFAIYALTEYSLATGKPDGLEFAAKTMDIITEKAWDPDYGGYFEIFLRDWTLAGPGSKGGDRKTLDVHMHLMEAFTNLYDCSKDTVHRRKLYEVISLLLNKILHPVYKTGIPQFTPDWQVAEQIKFDIVWGWDRFAEGNKKAHAGDNTSYGHNVEFAWLYHHALQILKSDVDPYLPLFKTIYDHAINNGIDWEFGGVYVEGSHKGEVYDKEKEFWQHAECLIGLLDAYLLFGDDIYWKAYKNVHGFVFDKMIHHKVGEWWPLLTREGKPIWTHMSHSWKVNYHTVRSMIQSIQRLQKIQERHLQ